MEIREMAKIAYNALDDKKGVDITVLDISEISTMADYFIIASGNNDNQVRAMVDNVDEEMHKIGKNPTHIEGYRSGDWVLMDYEDIIVHVFNKDNRLFYDLERIWRDGKVVEL